MRDPQPLRVGVIGHGAMGARRAASFAASQQCHVVVVADVDLAARTRVPTGIMVVPDAHALLDIRLDAVIVAVPPSAAPTLVTAALSRGAHVLCEKPPARTTAELRPVIAASAARPNQTLMYGFNHRLHASVRVAREIVVRGGLGAVLALRGTYTKSSLGTAGDWRLDAARSGGGILLDQGIHMLDLLRLFAGDLRPVAARVHGPPGAEVQVLARLQNSHGIVARLNSAATTGVPRFQLTIALERGQIDLRGLVTSSGRYAPETLTVSSLGQPVEHARWDTDDSLDYERDAFLSAIRAPFGDQPLDRSPSVLHGTLADAAAALALVEAIYALGRAP